MGVKKGVFWLLILIFSFSLTGCSFFKTACYNDSTDSKNYSEIKSIKNIKFEVINNGATSLNKTISTYFKENPNRSTDVESFDNQLHILGDLYVNGVVKEAQDGYILLDRDSYIIFVKTFDKSFNISEIKNEGNLIEALNTNTNNYFGFYPKDEDKSSFYKDVSDNAYKVIGVLDSRISLLKDVPLTGYVTLMEDRNKNSALMLVLSDKAFNSKAKKEMQYMVNSLVFDKTTQSTAFGSLEFTDKDFSIMLNSKNILFDTTETTTQIEIKNPGDKYEFVTFVDVNKDEKTYKAMSLRTTEKNIGEGFISTTMDNLTLSSMVYDKNSAVDLPFIEKRITERTDAFLTTIRDSSTVYTNIKSNGIITSEKSAYSIITYDLNKDKEVYSCIEIYKEDIVGDGAIVSYNISYKPLIIASNDCKVAYNEVMTEIGLKK